MRPWIKHIAADTMILAVWFFSVRAVVIHERGQLWNPLGASAAPLHAATGVQEQWFGIYYQNQQVGFSRVMLVPDERAGVPGLTITDWGKLSFNLLGTPQRLEVKAQTFIDANWRVQQLKARIESAAYNVEWEGRREGDELVLTITTPSSQATRRLKDLSKATVVSGLSSWISFYRLKPGQSGTAWSVNPLALNPVPVTFHVLRKEPFGGEEALVVETQTEGLLTTSWITAEGKVLKESSPLGWELRQGSELEARRWIAAKSEGADLMSATAVSVDRPIDAPERVNKLVLLVEGADAETLPQERPWQKTLPKTDAASHGVAVGSLKEPWCIVELEKPAALFSAETIPPRIQRYQQPGPFVQSDDPRIIRQARAIVGIPSGSLQDQTTALSRWVFLTMQKRLTVGIPSALDVLHTPEGDCHEHTVLFTALARSLGLPTRMMAGLVYQQGHFYYHAWPEVWAGRWIPTDPTLGQPVADATHLALTEAEGESITALAQFIGKINLRVLSLEENPAP